MRPEQLLPSCAHLVPPHRSMPGNNLCIYWFSGLGLTIIGSLGGDLKVITKHKFPPALFLEIVSKPKMNATISAPW